MVGTVIRLTVTIVACVLLVYYSMRGGVHLADRATCGAFGPGHGIAEFPSRFVGLGQQVPDDVRMLVGDVV